MSKIDKLTEGAQAHLDPGEVIEATIMGTYEVKVMGNDHPRKGIMLATDRRLVFYAKKLGGYDLESFPYPNISSFEASKSMAGRSIKFIASGNTVSLKWIRTTEDVDGFASLVRARAGSAPATSGSSGSVADELGKLAALVQQGVLSQPEYETAKARLLSQ